jgi:adenine-specific DNA-methyltransferase
MAKRNYSDLNKTELIQLLEARDRRDATRFGLVWEANEIERDKALNQDFVALDLDQSLSCGGAPWKNLIIEGDNFDALRYLRMTFAGRVKCIYIDPPYNTGNKDFVYNDRYVDKEDLWRHSKWCEFMFQRLTLAKDLLRQDGVIFVSIDDNEIATLRLMMDRIFGEQNFVGNCIWQKRYSASNDHKTIAPLHDYILVYQRSERWERQLLPRGEEKDRQYTLTDEGGVFRADNYTCNKSAEERPNLYYPITQPNTGVQILPKRTRVWAYSQDVHLQHVEEGLIYWGKNGLGKVPAFKRYKDRLRNDGVVPTTWWPHTEVGHNDSAKKEILAAIPEASRSFSTPKPSQLITRVLQIAGGTDDIILDFFAGSGTTAHSVHKLNDEDGGNRRVILVSSTEATEDEPDKNICRDVCATRVRRVIEGYGETPGLGGDFAYLRCRRITIGNLTDVDHEQVWIALQLTHMPTISPFDESQRFMIADSDGLRLIYVPHLKARGSSELLKAALASPSTIVYTWQPELVRQRLAEATNTQIEPVPESLAQRFGLRM